MLTPRTFIDPTRQPKPKKAKKGIRRVSLKRGRELREYAKRLKEFLALHPVCQVFLQERGITETTAAVFMLMLDPRVPRATEIHHTNGRTHSRLNDETYWLAISRVAHLKIHAEPSWAREQGYLV